jgi:hypothetical protein
MEKNLAVEKKELIPQVFMGVKGKDILLMLYKI